MTDLVRNILSLVERAEYKKAISILEPLVNDQTNLPLDAYLLLAHCYAGKGNILASQKIIESCLKGKQSLSNIDKVANIAYRLQLNLDSVCQAYLKFIKKSKPNAIAEYNLGYYLSKSFQPKKAIYHYSKSVKLGIERKEDVYNNIANIYSEQLADNQRAKEFIGKSLSIKPSYSHAIFNLAALYEQEGDIEKAKENLLKCIKYDPNNQLVMSRLLDLEKDNSKLLRIINHAKESVLSNQNQDLEYSLGRSYEKLGDYQTAWSHYRKANHINQKNQPQYNASEIEQRLKRIINLNQNFSDYSSDSKSTPIFITGMFRSGTTLLEQMLSCHSEISSSGERVFFPHIVKSQSLFSEGYHGTWSVNDLKKYAEEYTKESIACFGKVDNLIDKRPDNFWYIGLIRKVFPQAKFIFMDRGWKDISISIYAHRFGIQHNYATSIENIKHQYDCYKILVDFWMNKSNDFISIKYEDLVLEPEKTMKKMYSFLSLEYNNDFINFYKRKANVKTLSVWQVREPLYTASIGRWRKFSQDVGLFNE